MSIFACHPLRANFQLDLSPAFHVPVSVVDRVEKIWAAEQARAKGDLVNGTIYSLVDFTADRLVVQPCEYRVMLAQRRDESLKLGIRPLAVTGILLCRDGLVLGRRSDKVATEAGLWEPSPAGGVSQPDTLAQLFEELVEELGIRPAAILSVDICGLLEDCSTQVFDLIYMLSTSMSGAEISHSKLRASDEYDEIKIVPVDEIPSFINAQSVIPALNPMLKMAGLAL